MGKFVTVDITELLQLMEFYDVQTIPALIQAQEDHIKRLQDRLPPLVDTKPGYTPREG